MLTYGFLVLPVTWCAYNEDDLAKESRYKRFRCLYNDYVYNECASNEYLLNMSTATIKFNPSGWKVKMYGIPSGVHILPNQGAKWTDYCSTIVRNAHFSSDVQVLELILRTGGG